MRKAMKRVLIPAGSLTAAFAVLVLVAGCSESACEEAESKGKPTHACYAENQEAKQELRDSEDDLKEAEYGSLEAAEQAEHEQEVEEEVEEVEEIIKHEEAEETARTLRELEGK
jgi:hypothetical protein